MSNGHWQIDEQLLQLGCGRKTTERVKAYVEMWRKRCYFDDIPEELPDLLQATNRAPSWKKIAICLLKNDTKLRGLGFTEKTYDKVLISSIEAIRRDSDQGEFDLRVSFAELKPPTQTGFDVDLMQDKMGDLV